MNGESSDRDTEIEVESIKSHPNGVAGEPFRVVWFKLADGGMIRPRMMAVVFELDYCVAVLDLDDPDDCWRGDEFELPLRRAVAAWVGSLNKEAPGQWNGNERDGVAAEEPAASTDETSTGGDDATANG